MSMDKLKRSFKGIWIPAHIWLNKSLSIQEKVFLAEIDSLDNDDGCYASKYQSIKNIILRSMSYDLSTIINHRTVL